MPFSYPFLPPLGSSVHILRYSVRPSPIQTPSSPPPPPFLSPKKWEKKRKKTMQLQEQQQPRHWSLQSSQIRWLLLVPVRVAMSRLWRWRRNDNHDDERDKHSNALSTVCAWYLSCAIALPRPKVQIPNGFSVQLHMSNSSVHPTPHVKLLHPSNQLQMSNFPPSIPNFRFQIFNSSIYPTWDVKLLHPYPTLDVKLCHLSNSRCQAPSIHPSIHPTPDVEFYSFSYPTSWIF